MANSIGTWKSPSPIYEPTMNFLAKALFAHKKSEEIKSIKAQLGEWEIPHAPSGSRDTRAMVRQDATPTLSLYLPADPKTATEPISDSGFYQVEFPKNQPPLVLLTNLEHDFFKKKSGSSSQLSPIDQVYMKRIRTRSELQGKPIGEIDLTVEHGWQFTSSFAQFFLASQPAGRLDAPAYFGKLSFSYRDGSVDNPTLHLQLGSLRNNQPSSFTPVHPDLGNFRASYTNGGDTHNPGGDSINYNEKAQPAMNSYKSLIAHAVTLSNERLSDLESELTKAHLALREKQDSFKNHIQTGLDGLFGVPGKITSGKK